jgi:aryl-alcohol dehydrogenase-like predicted oxidoreductase
MGTDRNQRGGSRRWIVQAVEQSLKRLPTDRLDVYFLHKPDIATDFEQSLGALDDLVRQGKVVMGGLSSFPGSWIVESHTIAQQRCLHAPRVQQPSYSIVCRGVEEDGLPTTQRLGMGVMTWGPLDGGWLTERNVTGSRPEATGSQLIAERFDTTRKPVRRKQHIVTELTGLAAENGLTLPQLATLFCVEHPSVSAVILGARTPEQLTDLLAVADVRLERATLDRIDELVPPGTEVDPSLLRRHRRRSGDGVRSPAHRQLRLGAVRGPEATVIMVHSDRGGQSCSRCQPSAERRAEAKMAG